MRLCAPKSESGAVGVEPSRGDVHGHPAVLLVVDLGRVRSRQRMGPGRLAQEQCVVHVLEEMKLELA